MHTRVVEVTSKPEKARELCRMIEVQVLPILRKQHGFIDEFVMVSDSDPNRVIAQSVWKTQDDAHRYVSEQYETVLRIVQPLLEKPPDVRTFNVHISTAHRFTNTKAEKAA